MLTYGDISRDPTKLPVASVEALLARGFTHFLGNEQASKVVSAIRSHLVKTANDGKPESEHIKADSITKEQVSAFRDGNPDWVIATTKSIVDEALKSLDDGTIGTRAGGGPKVDPVTAAMNSIARSEVVTVLKANGLKTPKGDETIAFGNGETRTMAQMLANRLGAHGERIRKEAEKQVADAARRKARVEAEVKGKSAAELGI